MERATSAPIKATPVYIRCPKKLREKGAKQSHSCGRPMLKVGEDKHGVVEMRCPDGHTKFYGHVYAARFAFSSLDPDQSHHPEPPRFCPCCKIPLIVSKAEIRQGMIECGNCQIRLVFHEGRQAWEQANIS